MKKKNIEIVKKQLKTIASYQRGGMSSLQKEMYLNRIEAARTVLNDIAKTEPLRARVLELKYFDLKKTSEIADNIIYSEDHVKRLSREGIVLFVKSAIKLGYMSRD